MLARLEQATYGDQNFDLEHCKTILLSVTLLLIKIPNDPKKTWSNIWKKIKDLNLVYRPT